MIDLIKSPLFKDLTSIELNGNILDFHNDHIVTHIAYDIKSKTFTLTISPIYTGAKRDKYSISFGEVELVKLNLFSKRPKDNSTINNFYRGRFEIDGKAIEYSANGSSYFYLEFENGNQFEFFTREAKLFEL